MISAQVIKGIEELLGERGVQMRSGERLGDAVARELGISPAQAERLLEALHDGATVDEAMQRAKIAAIPSHSEFLNQLARKIGAALGRVAG
ncbi:MAG TPA: hypothetical protein VFW44_01065 [Bryobacteraceae bacterium]|nr:hypothetical protein [Bryobacteraceae bacterium]